MEPFVVGSLLVLASLAAGAIGFVVAIGKASAVDLDEIEKRWAGKLRDERESDRRHFAAAFEEMASLADTIKRHAAKVDGQKGGRPPKGEEPEPVPLTRDQQRERILAIARQRRA